MNLEFYRPFFTKDYLMGPNSLRILQALLEMHPLQLGADSRILDLGCGRGLTSFALCKETGAEVVASDLWTSRAENAARFAAWGVADRIIPVQEDGNDLKFFEESFDAVVSIDAYHYFAGEKGYFQNEILPILKPGGVALIGVPGIKEAYDTEISKTLGSWLGSECTMFHSVRQWREILGDSPEMESVWVGELDCFEAAWQDWLATDNEFARGDAACWENIIKPCSNFVGMIIRKK